jgi:cell division protein FtsL
MKSVLTVIALILALGAAGVAGYGFLERTREANSLNETIEKLNTRLAAAERKVNELMVEEEPSEETMTPKERDKNIVALREKVEDVTSQVENLDSRIVNLQQSDKQNKIQIGKLETKMENIPAGGAVASAVRREDIEELIEEKMKSQQRLGKEPPLSAVAARLGLEDFEKKALEDVLRKTKNEMMTLLKTPRADGSNKLDEIADVFIDIFKSGDPDSPESKKKAMKFFLSLGTEKIPGTEKSYLEEIGRIHEETRAAFKETLSEKQYQDFEALGIENAGDIKIDNDPLGTYIMQRAQAEGVPLPGQNQ